jgi:hypothetical protein
VAARSDDESKLAELLAQEEQKCPMIKNLPKMSAPRGRTMEGYVYVDPPALNRQAVQNWLRLAVAYVQTLPPKAKGKTKQRRGKQK